MKRQELLELLLEVTKENETLKKTVQLREEQLSSREITAGKAGSLAEAFLQLSGIFDAAQEAADTYLFNLKKTNERAKELLRSTQQEAARIREQAKQPEAEPSERTGRQTTEETEREA